MKMVFDDGRWGRTFMVKAHASKAKMEIDTIGGGWQWQASAFGGGNGRRWALAFDCGNGRQLWQRWAIETAFNGCGGGGIQFSWRWTTARRWRGENGWHNERTRRRRKKRQRNSQPAQ